MNPSSSTPPSPETIWGACDYGPTARRLAPVAEVVARVTAGAVPAASAVADLGAGHGHLAQALVHRGLRVTAVEPVAAMIEVGRRRLSGVDWVRARGESTGLPAGRLAGIASSFGTMFCDPPAGVREWRRILRPGGVLVMTAWDQCGFLAEMTRRMMAVLNPAAPTMPPHMAWGDDDVARERLSGHFTDIEIDHLDLPWSFAGVEEGMRLYEEGSPTHAWSLARSGARREELLQVLRAHLRESAAGDGAVEATAGYSLIRARSRG